MSTNKKITIITVNYNSTRYINELIKSIQKIDKIVKKIIIIDNNSNDFDKFESTNSKIKIIKNKKNFGFGKAVNQGIKKSKSDILLLLNPDSEIIDESIFKIYKIIQKNPKIGAIGGKILNKNNKQESMSANYKPNFLTGLFEFTNLKKLFPNNKYTKNFWPEKNKKIMKKKSIEVDSLCGAFVMFRKKLNDKIILFDERFFLYLEDIDFGLKIRKMGYKVIFYPSAQIKHWGGKSSKSKYKITLKYWYKSRKKFFLKHEGLILGGILYIIFSLEEIILFIYHTFKNEPAE